MSDLFAARTQMALSLGFHIVFAEIGIAMPLLMVIAEWRWRRTGDDVYLRLAKRWAKGSAVLFAVGAVHAARRADHRHALLAGGLRVFHRSDLPRRVSLRLGSHLRQRAHG